LSDEDHAAEIDLDTVSLLVPKAKEGCDAARSELFEHIQSYLLLMARRNNVQELQAKFGTSDVVQQSLAQVVQGFDDFRGQSTKEFYGWLNQIVANEAKKLQRDYHREKRDVKRERPMVADLSGSKNGFVAADKHPTPRSQALAAEQIELFHKALDRLPDEYAEVIRLRSLQRLTFKDVATQMDRSVNAVTKLWFRAILKIQQEVGSSDESRE